MSPRRVRRRLVLLALTATLARAEPLPPLQDAGGEYARLAARPEAQRCQSGEEVLLPVDLSEGLGLEANYDASRGRLRILYRMGFNHVTEGWNWQPLADPAREDYYRYKYLRSRSVVEERGSYENTSLFGGPRDIPLQWQHDSFFAFDNLYDFFPRGAGDDGGFAAEVAVAAEDGARLAAGQLRMALKGRLHPPCIADSTTFWKATFSRPVELTLRKRYLIGRLEEIWFYDAASWEIVARIQPPTRPGPLPSAQR